MGKWQNLTAKQKAQVIKFAIQNGVSNISDIRDTYNLYSDGGDLTHKYDGNSDTQYLRTEQPEVVMPVTGKTADTSWYEWWFANRQKQLHQNIETVKKNDRERDFTKYFIAYPNAEEDTKRMIKALGETKEYVGNAGMMEDSIGNSLARNVLASDIADYTPNISDDKVNLYLSYIQNGVHLPAYNSILYPGRWESPSKTTVTHERAHAADAFFPREAINYFTTAGEVNPEKYDTWYKRIFAPLHPKYPLGIYPSSGRRNSYLDNPNEVYSRLMEFRQFVGANPTYTWTKDDLKKYEPALNKFELRRYSDDDILKLLNEIAQNNSGFHKSENTYLAAFGGPLTHKKSTGGPLYPFSFEKNPFLKTPVVRYDQGGELDSWEQEALYRANRVYSNYEQAVDNKIPLWRIPLQKQLKNLGLPSGLSNCTLSATQWVDPNNPIMSAATIFNSPSSGYTKINSKDAVPGNLLITKNPETGGYHTMMIEGFTDSGEPILRYSNGDHTQDALRTNITLSEYHRRDNNQGGNHTEDHYFRYNYPNEVFLPEVTVWAQKGHKKSGKEQEETQSLDTRKVDIDAWYAGNNNRKRGVNTEELKQFQDSLIANNIPLAQRLAILGTSAQETGTEGAASYGIGGMGLLGLSGQRMDSALVSHNPDTVGMQIHFLIQDLKKRHSDNWLEGGAGGPTIKTGKEGFEKFWGGNDVDTITQVLNKSYIRPAERLNAWKNRAEVAKSMLKYLK